MKKIPAPIAVTVVILILIVSGIIIYRTMNPPGGDSGNISALATQVTHAAPTNTPNLPSNANPTRGAMMRGGKK